MTSDAREIENKVRAAVGVALLEPIVKGTPKAADKASVKASAKASEKLLAGHPGEEKA